MFLCPACAQDEQTRLSRAAVRAGIDQRADIAGQLAHRRDSLFALRFPVVEPAAPRADEVGVRVCHIFRRLPQDISTADLNRAIQLFDAISDSIARGHSFEHFLTTYSDETTDFLIGRHRVPTELEDAAFALSIGQTSRPILSPAGIHILKVLAVERMSPDVYGPGSPAAAAHFRSFDAEALGRAFGYRAEQAAMDEAAQGKIAGQRTLFHLGRTAYDTDGLRLYAAAHPAAADRQLDGYVRKSILDYAYAHFTDDDSPLAIDYRHYRDSLLADAYIRQATEEQITEHNLQAYFRAHRDDYRYPSVRYRGVVVHAIDKRTARQVRRFLRSLPEAERPHAAALTFGGPDHPEVVTEQGLFAIGDNAYVDAEAFHGPKPAPLSTHPVTIVMGRRLTAPDDYHEVAERVEADLRRHLISQQMAALEGE